MKRRWGQAFISCLLALALFIPSFASTINAAPLSEGQIVDAGGTLYYDKNGKAVTAQSLGENSSIVSVSKTLQGTDVENEFIINLDVKTTTKIQDVKFNTDAAVVLVLDISGSMAGSYIADLKKAAISFLESFAKVEGNAKRYVSLVTFATDARIEYGWLDATNSTNLDNLKTKINSLNATGGTFMQGGLLMARNLLRTDALPLGTDNEVIENRSVILFTDGQPTYSSSLPVSPNGYANTRDRGGQVDYSLIFTAAPFEC